MESRLKALQIQLDEKTRRNCMVFMQHMDTEVTNALNLCNDLGYLKFSNFKKKDEVQLSQAELKEQNKTATRGVCLVQGTFDEVANEMITETTMDFKTTSINCHGPDFLDGEVLHVLRERTPEEPNRFACLKWQVTKSLSPTKAQNRDYLYVEIVDEFITDDGQRIGYCFSRSISLDDENARLKNRQLIRGIKYSLHTFKAIIAGGANGKEERIELSTMAITDYKGEKPLETSLLNRMSEASALSGARIRALMISRRLGYLRFTSRKNHVEKKERSMCNVCSKGFSIMRHKHNCRGCGEVICSSCSNDHEILFNEEKNKLLLCHRCVIKANKIPLLLPYYSKPMERSSSASSTDFRLSEERVSFSPSPDRTTIGVSDPSKEREELKKEKERNTVSTSTPSLGSQRRKAPGHNSAAPVVPAGEDKSAHAKAMISMMDSSKTMSFDEMRTSRQMIKRGTSIQLDLGVDRFSVSPPPLPPHHSVSTPSPSLQKDTSVKPAAQLEHILSNLTGDISATLMSFGTTQDKILGDVRNLEPQILSVQKRTTETIQRATETFNKRLSSVRKSSSQITQRLSDQIQRKLSSSPPLYPGQDVFVVEPEPEVYVADPEQEDGESDIRRSYYESNEEESDIRHSYYESNEEESDIRHSYFESNEEESDIRSSYFESPNSTSFGEDTKDLEDVEKPPAGWKAITSSKGAVYYQNILDGRTQWIFPKDEEAVETVRSSGLLSRNSYVTL